MGMESLEVFVWGGGGLARRAFAAGAAVVYGTAFLSFLLISPPVMLRVGLAPFVLVQAIALWCWFCLHAKRLRDADRRIGVAAGTPALYAPAVFLLLPFLSVLAPFGAGSQYARGVWLPAHPLRFTHA